jgi:hypothetical protein
VVANLAVLGDVAIPGLVKNGKGKLTWRAFGLLQAEHVNFLLFEKADYEAGTEPYGINVPSGNSERHG